MMNWDIEKERKVKQKTDKLILDQNNKTEHMVQYRMLKFYVKMGVKVTKIHRVFKFKLLDILY